MKRLRQAVALLLATMMLGLPATGAERDCEAGPIRRAEIDEALRRAVAEEEARREGIRSLLRRQDVRALAADLGFDALALRKAEDAVGTLDGAELERVASYAEELNENLAGGHTITISLVALLLIIIIIILLAD